MRIVVYIVLFALVSVVIGTLLVRDHASREKIARLDRVCEHVREQLCLRLAELDQRPGAGHVQLPSNVEIDACAPGIWNDWKLGDAVKNDGEGGYDKDLRSQVDRVVQAIPPLYPDARECRGVTSAQ